MTWIQVSAYCHNDDCDAFTDRLTALGAVSVTLLDAHDTQDILEPLPGQNPLWDNLKLVGLFHADADITHIVETLTPLMTDVRAEPLEDKDWVREWMQHFKPLCFGNRFWICPSWCAPPDPTAPHILLDPGLAFGTGTHPTTALCLTWLAEHLEPGCQLIDYGCGSGILAIAAKKLGARQVTAVDYDPQAIEATINNARQNDLSNDDIQVYLSNAYPSLQADVVMANIIAGPLISLAPTLQALLAPNGTLVLSGLLVSQIEWVQAAYTECTFLEPTVHDEWVRLIGYKKP